VRRLRLAACAATLTLLTSACSTAAWQNVGMGVGDFTTTWTIGSCHRLDQLEQTDPLYPSDTSPAVPCDEPHESETYAVVPIVGRAATYPQRPNPVWLEHTLAGACTWTAMTTYIGARRIDALQDLSVLQVLPSEPEWQRGVRKIRCDVLIGPRGSAYIAKISAPLHGILTRSAGDQYRVCRAYGQQVGCDQPHDGELINTWIKFSDAELRHDTVKQQTTKILAACRTQAAAYLGAPPDAWGGLVLSAELPDTPGDAAMKAGRCWLADTHPGQEWTGSLLTNKIRLLP
jgi:Septum formation